MKHLLLILILGYSGPLYSQNNASSEIKDTSSNNKLELEIGANIGAGLVRNIIAPTVSGNLMISMNNKSGIAVGYSGYFFFNKNEADKNKMFVNSFINLEFLFRDGLIKGFFLSGEDNWGGIGGSYILNEQGDYFDNNAFKIYYIKKLRYIKIMPELIIDDRNVFPGLTIVF